MLHPFFSYFGSKYKLARLYSSPVHNTIVEPFAGSAGYSLLYSDKKVMLYDTYKPVVALWNYLIKVKVSEVLGLPVRAFTKDDPISECKIPTEARTLIGFWSSESQTYASNYVQSKSRGGNWSERKRAMIAGQLQYIRHWTAELKSYKDVDNMRATWHIDPPYQQAGKRYRHNAIDYKFLSKWCKERRGQVMVCEQGGAKWLPQIFDGS
jgi:D12 class N6 adenine-specific DNA methyltransferase